MITAMRDRDTEIGKGHTWCRPTDWDAVDDARSKQAERARRGLESLAAV